jgi:hypothetical protein
MIRLFVLVVLLLSCSCTPLGRYKSAASRLLYEQGTQSYFCWQKAYEKDRGLDPTQDAYTFCKNKEATPAVNLCIRKLSENAPDRLDISTAKDNLKSCMQDSGWVHTNYMTISD